MAPPPPSRKIPPGSTGDPLLGPKRKEPPGAAGGEFLGAKSQDLPRPTVENLPRSPTGPPSKDLEAYRAKRAAGRTPEPFGGAAASRPRLFVVQKHAARALHYDFRLELGGVLVSWAVPKGPSLDPAEKRLAMHVEDHPVEYADFEGIIPKDNYGAGEVIVWDRGVWTPLEDPGEGMQKGKLLFELKGYKLRGGWTLVRT